MSDQHVIPISGREHVAGTDCWCAPRVDDGVPHNNGNRVWIHNEEVTPRALYERHLAKMADGSSLRKAYDRVSAGAATAADLIACAEWELWETLYSLPLDDKPKPSDEHPRGLDVSHANACAFRAVACLESLQRLLGAKP